MNEHNVSRPRFAYSSYGLVASVLLAAACGASEPLGDRSVEVPLSKENADDVAPATAAGMARIETTTGNVVITVTGLPPLTGEVYEGWLAGGGEDPLSTGRFQTLASGAGGSMITLGDLSSSSYDRVVITVEPEPDPTPKPDPRHSIAGDIP